MMISIILTGVQSAEDSPPLCRPEHQESCARSRISVANDLSTRRWWLPTKTKGVLRDQERAQDIERTRVVVMAGDIPDGQVLSDGKTRCRCCMKDHSKRRSTTCSQLSQSYARTSLSLKLRLNMVEALTRT